MKKEQNNRRLARDREKLKQLEQQLEQEKKVSREMANLIQFLERNEELSKDTFRQKTRELEEIISIKEGDLNIEHRQRQRAEQRVSELEHKLSQMEQSKHEMDQRRLQRGRESGQRWEEEKGKLLEELGDSEKKMILLGNENKRLKEKIEEIEEGFRAKTESVKEIVEKLNQANMKFKKVEMSFLESEKMNVGLKTQFQELAKLSEKQKAKIEELGKLLEMEHGKKDAMERENQVLVLEIEEMKKQLEQEKRRRTQLEQHLIEFKEKTKNGVQNKHKITSLDHLRTFQGDFDSVPQMKKLESSVQNDHSNREETFQKIQWEPQTMNQKSNLNQQKPENQKRNQSHFGTSNQTQETKKSFESRNNFQISEKRYLNNETAGPAKNLKYSAPFQSNGRASQNSYFRLNRDDTNNSISRVGRTVSPSPVRRIKLEDRRIISSQKPSSNRRFVTKIYSSAEKRFVPKNPTTTQTTQNSKFAPTKRIVKQSIRSGNFISRDTGPPKTGPETVYYAVNGASHGQQKSGKVGELLNQIKTNIEADQFGSTTLGNEKYEISELSSFGNSFAPSELRQKPVEVYNLELYTNGKEMHTTAKTKTLDSLGRSESSHRYTRKKVHTSPNFVEYASTNSNIKSPNQMSTHLEDSQYDSDEESEMNFMVGQEADVNSQFEFFKNQIKENFSKRRSRAREEPSQHGESPGPVGRE